jgi:hypothetical protein
MLDLPFSPDDLYVLYTEDDRHPEGCPLASGGRLLQRLGGNLPGFERPTRKRSSGHVTMGWGAGPSACRSCTGRAVELVQPFHRGGT